MSFETQDPSGYIWFIKIPKTHEIIENVPGLVNPWENHFEHHNPGEYLYNQGEVLDILKIYAVNLVTFKMEKFEEVKDIIPNLIDFIGHLHIITNTIVSKIIYCVIDAHINMVFRTYFLGLIPKSLIETYKIIVRETTMGLDPNKMYLEKFFVNALHEIDKIIDVYNDTVIDKTKLN